MISTNPFDNLFDDSPKENLYNFPNDMNPKVRVYLEQHMRENRIDDDQIIEIMQKRNTLSETSGENASIKKETIKLINQTNPAQWESAKITSEESDAFQKKLGTFNDQGEMGVFIFDSEFKKTADGDNNLFGAEIDAIRIFTTPSYLIINGALENDRTSLNEWIQKRSESRLNADLEKALEHTAELAKVLASGLNKLPPFEGLLYRGASMSKSEYEAWSKGEKKILFTNKFSSFSTNVSTGEFFARSSARSYIKDTGMEHRPVLYIIKSETSKNISGYSLAPGEEERIYIPGRTFQLIDLDEESVPGLAILYMKELN